MDPVKFVWLAVCFDYLFLCAFCAFGAQNHCKKYVFACVQLNSGENNVFFCIVSNFTAKIRALIVFPHVFCAFGAHDVVKTHACDLWNGNIMCWYMFFMFSTSFHMFTDKSRESKILCFCMCFAVWQAWRIQLPISITDPYGGDAPPL